MVKQILPAIAILIFLSSCTTFKPLNFTSNKQVVSSPAPAASAKFIENISVTPEATITDKTAFNPGPQMPLNTNTRTADKTPAMAQENKEIADLMALRNKASVESASSVQLKYSVLMNTEVENLPSKPLLDGVDEWYGVRYRTGGNTKTGVDCSGFTVAVYSSVYGISLPRVSRDQYRISRKISTTELQEGDLVFFNTRGSGVSHVGVYLGNNKFIHASVSRGIMVNGLFEPYYLKRYIGAGRIDDKQMVSASN
jgi:cell wall-associated NlpC family hydrolase